MILNIQDKFNKALPADPNRNNTIRQVTASCYSYVHPSPTANPLLLHSSTEMLHELGLTALDAKSPAFLKVFTGNELLPDTQPYAMCYGGHQFGHWAGQLGDGRAINLCEVEHNTKNWALQLKGAGKTPYSRTADGLAVLRSSIREYLCSEAMFHLGVPTTRALSLALTGNEVLRDVMYDGNPAYEKGAVVCRTAESFLRFGSFQIFAARQDKKTLKILLDYTINNHYAHLGVPTKSVYINFFKEVAQRSLDMVIHWQRVGFVHGVMNTDNLSILGLTIDYGPYGWLEGYDHGWTPNTTDKGQKRYRYGAQAEMVHWNLYQLANALYPIILEAAPLEAILKKFVGQYRSRYLLMMKSKLGLFEENDADAKLIQDLEALLQESETDMTLFFRLLSKVTKEDKENGFNKISPAFYEIYEVQNNLKPNWEAWFIAYHHRLNQESLTDVQRRTKMNAVNPKYVLRNYMAQLAIDAADKGNYDMIEELYQLLKKPYDEQMEQEKWFAKRPEWARHKVGCSMLSCSS